MLIRDAAYDGLPKKIRAELHERLADWLEATGPGAAEEIVGYHLEQAYRLSVDVAGEGSARELGGRAAERLAGAGRKAFLRGDMPAAADLLTRAAELRSQDERGWLELAPDLGVALREIGELDRSETVLSAAIERAGAMGDRRSEALALVERSALRLIGYRDRRTDEAEDAAEHAVVVFSELGDDHGLARAWFLIGRVEWIKGRAAAMEAALERGLVHARRGGNARDAPTILRTLALAALFGPRPIEEALERCREIRREAGGDLAAEAVVATVVAGLEARRGNFEEARQLQARSEHLLRELGLGANAAGVGMYSGLLELLASDPVAAEAALRRAHEALERLGDRGGVATTAALLAEAMYAQGRDGEADRYALESAEAASPEDLVSQLLWRQVRAKVLGRRGDHDDAERIAREGVGLAGKTDFPWVLGDSLVALGAVLRGAGKAKAAAAALEDALRLYEAKGDLVSGRKTRELLAELKPAALDPTAPTR
jgi:tetratricopeptide (TPR) repeat protein